MRKIIGCLLLSVVWVPFLQAGDSLYWDEWANQYYRELRGLQSSFDLQQQALGKQMADLNTYFLSGTYDDPQGFMEHYRTRIRLETALWQNRELESLQLLRVRYRKGLELVKLLYEKILALNHHFSGMQTYQNVLLLSNPHSFPEFDRINQLLSDKLKKRNALTLPGLLQSNPYLMATFSVVAAFLGEGDSKEKQAELDAISCILDFTVRMNADLSTIQHETVYLKEANQQLKKECERLFEDYVKVIGYLVPLEKCRANDDWENLYWELEEKIKTLEAGLLESDPANPYQNKKLDREQVNLEFATQRVAEFISRYSDFINQGTQYYRKFDNIVGSYTNEASCQEVLPTQFVDLKTEISGTILKFNETYYLPEIQGSRMKNLLYGYVE